MLRPALLRQSPLIMQFYVPSLLVTICEGLLVPILPLYAANFGAGYGLAGLLLSSAAIGLILGDLPGGALLQRMGNRAAMLFGVGGASFCIALMSLVTHIGLAIVLMLTAGVFIAFYNLSRHIFITEATHIFGRGRAISTYGGVYRLGLFIGPALGGFIGGAFGLRAVFIAYALTSALTIACIYAYVPADRAEQGALARPHHRQRLWETFKQHRRILAVAGVGQLLGMAIRAGRQVIIPLYAAQILGLPVTTIGVIVSLSSAMDMGVFFVAGILMDRYGRKYAIVPTFILQGLAMLCVPLTTSALGLLAVSCAIGLANGIGSGTMLTLGSDLSPHGARGEFLGLWRLVGDTGTMVAPIVIGAVADVLVLSASAVVIAFSGIAAGVIFLLFVPETLDKNKRKAHYRDDA